MENILFKEKQRFSQWWLWVILLGIDGLIFYGFFKQVIGGQPFGDKPGSDAELTFVTVLVILISFLFFLFSLETVIKTDGIFVRFFPFHISYKHYSWDKISKLYVRQYRPIREYGGWGVRLGMFGKGKAYNISGNKGLQLEFTNHDKLLIGTNKPEELSEVLNKLKQRHL